MNVYQRILFNLLWAGAYCWLLNNSGKPNWWAVSAYLHDLGSIPDI